MVPIARRYLLSDKPRVTISAGGVAFAVLLIVLMLALYRGIYDQAGRFATSAPSELWVRQAGSADPSHGASILDNSVLAQLTDVPGVAAAQPLFARTMLIGTSPLEGSYALVVSIPEGPLFAATTESFGVPSMPGPGQIILSDPVAQKVGAGAGDTVYIGSSALKVGEVSSLIDSAFSAMVVVSPADAAPLFRNSGAFSFALVALEAQADPARVESTIEAMVPGTNAATREQFAGALRREVEEGFLPIVAVLGAVAFVVGLSVIALTIYTSTVERVRDYGVLKAVGASPGQLFSIVLRQSVIVTLLGYALGVLLAVGAGSLLADAVPEFTTLYRWQDILVVLGAAVIMSVVAAIVPIRKVALVDPTMVFRA